MLIPAPLPRLADTPPENDPHVGFAVSACGSVRFHVWVCYAGYAARLAATIGNATAKIQNSVSKSRTCPRTHQHEKARSASSRRRAGVPKIKYKDYVTYVACGGIAPRRLLSSLAGLLVFLRPCGRKLFKNYVQKLFKSCLFSEANF